MYKSAKYLQVIGMFTIKVTDIVLQIYINASVTVKVEPVHQAYFENTP